MHRNDRIVHAADGTPIAYHVSDPGLDHVLLYSNGYATSHYYWKHIHAHFRGRATQITWDYRGHGDSDAARDPGQVTIANMARDLERVLDAAGVARATLVGFSFGCQVTLEAWRHFPERIDGIAVALGTFEHPFDNVFHPRVGPQLFRVFRRAAPRLGGVAMRVAGAAARVPFNVAVAKRLGAVEANIANDDMQPFFEHFNDMDGKTWAALGIAAQQHSARDLLPHITAPTLIVGGGEDVWTPVRMSELMAETIPGAEYVFIPTASHTALLGHAPRMIQEFDGFFSRHRLVAPLDAPHLVQDMDSEE